MSKKILILITHSLGELDVVFPIFSRIFSEQKVEVELVFTVDTIFNKFKRDDFYQFFVKKYKIKSFFCKIYKYKSFNDTSMRERLLVSVKNLIIFLYNAKILFLTKKAVLADVFMHEHTNQLSSNWLLYLYRFLLNKKIFVYSHGHSIHSASVRIPTVFAHKSTVLSFDNYAKKYWNELGYCSQFVIGYPKFYPEWVEVIENYLTQSRNKEEFVLIYSRPIHEYFVDQDKYMKLLISSCESIRSKFNNILIIIKLHPRESEDFIRKIFTDNNIENIEISYDTTLSYSKFCILSISFWTSAILDSLSGGTPTLEYYIEAEKFRESEPIGSEFKKLGIISVDNKSDLCYYISNMNQLKSNNAVAVKKFTRNINTGFL